MKLKEFIKRVYFNDKPLKFSDYEKSRKTFIFEGCTAVGIFSLTSGAFLAGFANYLGATDEFNGIIGAIPAMVNTVQLISSMVFEKMVHRKFLITIMCFFHRMLLASYVFIPLVFKSTQSRLWALAVMYGLSYLSASFVTPASSKWIVDLTPNNIRGSYFSKKDSLSLAFVTIITLIMGKVLDLFKDRGNAYGGFLVVNLFVMVLAILNFGLLSSVKEPKSTPNPNKVRLKDTLTLPLRNKNFRKVIILSVIWNIGLQIGGPFFAVYQVTGLKLEYTYMMAMGVISSLIRVFITKYWGKLADSKSWFLTTKTSICMLAIVHLCWAFVDTSNVRILMPILAIVGGIAWSGINLSFFNIQFVLAPKEGTTIYLGTSAALGGLIGFISALAGSTVVKILKPYKFKILGFSIGNMQFVFLLSGILLIFCVLYVHFFMKYDKNTV